MNYFFLLFSLSILLISSSCEEDLASPITTTTCEDCITMLPLGDSRVQGARPEFESYRYELWKQLVATNVSFDFTGSRVDEGSYPLFQGKSFDTDHEGTGGLTTDGVWEVINAKVTTTNAPDVVLLGIGGNDLIGGRSAEATIDNINQIIDYLQSKNDSIVILLEQIAPGLSSFMTNDLQLIFESFNQEIPRVATSQTSATSKVLAVNMAEDWRDNYLADDVHYNEAGASVVAGRYFETLSDFFQW